MTKQYSKTEYPLRNEIKILNSFPCLIFKNSKDTNKNARLKSEASRPLFSEGTTCENFVREKSNT